MLALASWMIAAYYWNKLPAVIPTHFGIDGQANDWADKSIFSVFLLPFLQSMLLGLFIFIYNNPQYSNIPSTMWLIVLSEENREKAYGLIRAMITGITLWMGILLTYITYAANAAAIKPMSGLSPWVVLIIVGLMIGWSIFWSTKIYSETKRMITSSKK
jgi:uncharacterized membrane protein